jgi:hypothetical protein
MFPPHREPVDRVAWGSMGVGGLALVAALVLLLIEHVVYWPGVLGASAVVAGVVGVARSRRYTSGLGPAIAGIVCGVVTIALTVGEFVVASIAATAAA